MKKLLLKLANKIYVKYGIVSTINLNGKYTIDRYEDVVFCVNEIQLNNEYGGMQKAEVKLATQDYSKVFTF